MESSFITEYRNLLERKAKMEKKLLSLPQGYISHKTISGKSYAYLQTRVNGKTVSEYLKADKVEAVTAGIALRKQYESELPAIEHRLAELEQAAQLIGHGLDRRLLLLRCSAGMDRIDAEQKAKSVTFANAMNAVEGVPVSPETAADLSKWQDGNISFLSVFEAALRRYGFAMEDWVEK